MSLALYRKYRPATFAELKGQEHVAEPLQQALRNGRVNHAYLFSGPRGCGKTSSARILARSLNCERGPTPDPCGECDSCVALGPAGSGHIDVIEIDAASHGGVDDARDLRERAFFAPVAARFKIYIIDEAHMVTREGFNALLKLVEEPPPHLKFIFATTEPEKVIGTIRSRTHHYPFRLMPPGVLRDLLEEILRSEKVEFEAAALPLVVRAGAGSARDSLSILDQLLAGSDEAGITYARAVSLLGYTDSALLDEVVDAFVARDGAAVFAAVDRVIESGQDPRRFAADLLERVRDLVVLANVPDAGATGLLDMPQDELERMRDQVAGMGQGELTRAADLLHTGLTEMRGATSPRLLLELICARILLPGAYDDEVSVFARLDRLERRFAMGGGEAPVRPPARPAQPAPAPARPAPAQPPPTQGGDPTSIVQRGAVPAEAERRSVDNSPAPAAARDGGDAAPRTRSQDPAPPPRAAEPAPAPQAARPPAQPTPQAAPPPAAAPAAAGGLDIGAVHRSWGDILEAVKQRSKVAWIMLDGTQPASVEQNVLTVAFAEEGKRKGFAVGGKDVVFRAVLKEYLGVDWRVETVLADPRTVRPMGGDSRPSGPTGPPGPPAGTVRSAGASQPPSAARPNTATAARDRPAEPPPPPPPDGPAPMDESDEVDPDGDADASTDTEFSGMALIQRELGGQIIREIDNT
ncbi:DNA polymerase III subunit gamma and tau [Actinomadura sp. HBU206391]|uniref:DNA polymerase III subunit gamma and tau n=1 Tax=Actinomadura sp. HBU206391 TaxID=2731692 RepID=UPI00164F9418|nr:DNA polymerase III subunit gamma and tau [Actinomadura sp. HBU206391]MBC6456414.1 DNA polymerase III subunit gamma and tau [Actinomadura sp. HBU206391]